MPITRKQFDNSTDTLSAKVLRFLESNPDDAFELEEIAEAAGGRQLKFWAILALPNRQGNLQFKEA